MNREEMLFKMGQLYGLLEEIDIDLVEKIIKDGLYHEYYTETLKLFLKFRKESDELQRKSGHLRINLNLDKF